MTHWIRCARGGSAGLGLLGGNGIKVHAGDMLNQCLGWTAKGRNS